MLELDILLQGFVQQEWDNLNPDQKDAFVLLLDADDPDLLDWLLHKKVADKQSLREIISLIHTHQQI